MGTAYRVKVVAPSLSDAERDDLARVISGELENVNRKMSTYQDGSELSRFNHASATDAFALSSDTLCVFTEAARVSELTAGAFDITVGPLVDAWGFGPAKPERTPTEEELAALRESVGWRTILIDATAVTVRKTHAATRCDLSAIAKGYAVDRVSEALTRLGRQSHMVEVGGEVRTAGRNAAGEPWRIAVEKPFAGSTALQRVVRLGDDAMATSGDYRNFIERDGIRYSHTIDPRTGRPVMHRLASVSVLHKSCMTADALATALMVMGEEEALTFATNHELAVLLLIRGDDGGFTEAATPAFAALSIE
jgi:thiamine biosynthesis lipoprotein